MVYSIFVDLFLLMYKMITFINVKNNSVNGPWFVSVFLIWPLNSFCYANSHQRLYFLTPPPPVLSPPIEPPPSTTIHPFLLDLRLSFYHRINFITQLLASPLLPLYYSCTCSDHTCFVCVCI